MKLPVFVLTILSLARATFGAAIKTAEPGWETEIVTMPDGSTETLYIRHAFVHANTDHMGAPNCTQPYSNVTYHLGHPPASDSGGCGIDNSTEVHRVTWFEAVDRMDCRSMLYQMGSGMYWDGLDGRSGQYWSLFKKDDCEIGVTRKDGGSNTITIRGDQLQTAITYAINNDALANEDGLFALEGEMECPNYNNTCFTWTLGNTNFTTSSQHHWKVKADESDDEWMARKSTADTNVAHATDSNSYSIITRHPGEPPNDSGCANFDSWGTSVEVDRVSWFKSVDRNDCYSMLGGLLAGVYWDGLDGRSGQWWSLVKQGDCEVGVTRTDGGSDTITIAGDEISRAVTTALHNDSLANDDGRYSLQGKMQCPMFNNVCFEWTIGNTNWRPTARASPIPPSLRSMDEVNTVSTKILFVADYDKGLCEAPVLYKAPWVAPAELSQCLELSNQIMSRPGYWKAWDWDGGLWQLARLGDCEFGIGRTDGLTAESRIGNLDVGNLIKYVSNPENGFVVGNEVQVGGSMRCLGDHMTFTVGNTNWPIAKSG